MAEIKKGGQQRSRPLSSMGFLVPYVPFFP